MVSRHPAEGDQPRPREIKLFSPAVLSAFNEQYQTEVNEVERTASGTFLNIDLKIIDLSRYTADELQQISIKLQAYQHTFEEKQLRPSTRLESMIKMIDHLIRADNDKISGQPVIFKKDLREETFPE